MGRENERRKEKKEKYGLAGTLLRRISARCVCLLHACVGETTWCLSTLLTVPVDYTPVV